MSPLSILFLTAFVVCVGYQPSVALAEKSAAAARIDRDVDTALTKLYETTPLAETLRKEAKGVLVFRKEAKGVLVFPSVVKGGLMIGAQYGKGALRKDGETAGYYNAFSASYGLQIGVQAFGYALFFMNEKALSYLEESSGWEIGVGPTIVVLDAGAAKSLSTTTAKDDIYAFIFDQKGLMAGVALQGSKITKIDP